MYIIIDGKKLMDFSIVDFKFIRLGFNGTFLCIAFIRVQELPFWYYNYDTRPPLNLCWVYRK